MIILLKTVAQNLLAPYRRYCAKLCAAFLIFVFITLHTAQAAVDYGVGRVRSCNIDGNGGVSVEGLDWNPTHGGKDVEFVLSNPVCLAFVLSSYAAVKVAIAVMNYNCGTGSGVPRLVPSPLMDVWDIGKASIRGAASPNCKAGILGAVSSFATLLGLMSATYAVAKDVYNNSQICGAEWLKPSSLEYNFSVAAYKATVQGQINSWIRERKTANLTFDNKTYREWYYGGVEVVDNPVSGDVCYDVTQAKVNDTHPRQKYYLKGSEIGNYNCKKYLLQPGQNDPLTGAPNTDVDRTNELKTAYECCLRRSSEHICIEYDGLHRRISKTIVAETFGSTDVDGIRSFCRAGTRCDIDGITFAAKFADNERMICAQTFSLCPYNFSLGGGTEYCDYYKDGIWDSGLGKWKMITPEQVSKGDCSPRSEIRNVDCSYNSKAGKCKNYCQYLTHCTRTSDVFPYRSGISSPYFAEACLNFEGDSQNKTAFKGGFILGSQRHFSAPIAQCVKETLENVFYNRAGHSQCLNVNEYPSAGGICPSGLYVTDGAFSFKKGNFVKTKSFFTTIQDNLQLAVKLALTFSVMLYGMNLLIGKADIRQKKDIMVYFLKIALVAYFATGDAWQGMFFKGVYGASMEFSRMVFKIKTGDVEEKRDGCQFGKVYLENGTEISSGKTYPDGKEYLAIWDTLDCKIMRYLGFGPEVSAANITMLVLASFLTGPIGIYFALSVLIFGILLVAATLRALHIFLSSAISIIIMVFVSPLIIPLALFERTKGIYEGWLKELISFCLQPMILFAYIAIFITVMDQVLIGSAEFYGPGPFKTLNCDKKCVDNVGVIVPYVNNQMPACDKVGEKTIDPLNDSAACLISFDSFGTFPGLEIIGITIPIMTHLFESHVKERILTLLKATLMIFLLYKFMDEIPGITSSLIGGTKLPGSNADGFAMLKKTIGVAREIQERLARGASKVAKKGASKARDGIRSASSSGRGIKEPEGGGGASDETRSSSGGASDKPRDSSGGASDNTKKAP